MLGEGTEALGGVAVGREGKVGVGAGERLGVKRPQAVALGGLALGLARGVGDIERKGAQQCVQAAAHGHCLIVLGGLQANDARYGVGQAVSQRRTEHLRRGQALRVAVVASSGQAVLDLTATDHER
ncbi:hypothetical protein D3C79_265900 [compost metagenome]